MSRLFVSLLLVLGSVSSVQGQTDYGNRGLTQNSFGGAGFGTKGTTIVTGSYRFTTQSGELKSDNTESIDLDEESRLNLSVGLGRFISDGVLLRADFSVRRSTSENKDAETESNDIRYSIGAMPTFYILLEPQKEIYGLVYGRLEHYSGTNEIDSDDSDMELDVSGLTYGAGVGLAFNIGGASGAFFQFTLGYHVSSDTLEVKTSGDAVEAEVDTSGIKSALEVGGYF